MKLQKPCSFALALGLASAISASAATVINPVDIALTGGAATLFPVVNLINGSGLESQLNTGDVLPATWNHEWGQNVNLNSWVSTDPGGFPADWFAASGTIPTFVIDLGQDYQLDTVHLWAYGGASGVNGTVQGNSARAFSFRFNTDAQGNSTFSGPAVAVGSLAHAPATGTAPGFLLPRGDFSVGSQTARYVEMQITDNWFVAPGDGSTMNENGFLTRGGDRVGLGEVRFSVVPEPTTYGLLAAGAALLLALRRRKS